MIHIFNVAFYISANYVMISSFKDTMKSNIKQTHMLNDSKNALFKRHSRHFDSDHSAWLAFNTIPLFGRCYMYLY